MKLVIGLGNPGEKYEGTRHNVGFCFLDLLVKHKRISAVGIENNFIYEKKFNSEIFETQIVGEKIILVKPQTFMNSSGNAVRKITDFYKVDLSEILVVCDDLDLPIGKCRIRHDGSSAGHNGVNDIIEKLGSNQFARLRIGIANFIIGSTESDAIQEKPDAKIFVLEKFEKREQPIVDKMIRNAVEYIIEYFIEKREILATTLEI